MLQALIIAYHFPPTGGAGTQRSSKLVKYLPDEGVEPVVVCGPGPAGTRWEPADATMSDDVPRGTAIYRATANDSERPFAQWWGDEIASVGAEAIAEHDIDVVLITMSPFEGLEPAITLARRHGLPVVADLRDPWALDEVRKYRSRWHRQIETKKMGALLAQCDQVVMNTLEARTALLDTFSQLNPDRVASIPNGFDQDDFAADAPERNGDEFRIVHTGYLHTALASANARNRTAKRVLGGWLWDVDLSTRSHIVLLAAVHELRHRNPELGARTKVILAGVLTEADVSAIASSGIENCVSTPGYVSHGEAVALMRSADCLFLPMHDIPPGKRARIVPGKTYEYLASGRPILAAVPPGDARDLICGTRAGIAVPPSDIDAMADALAAIAQSPDSYAGVREGLDEFERRTIATRMADVLQRAIDGRT